MKLASKHLLLLIATVSIARPGPAQTLSLHYNFDEASSGNTSTLDRGIAPAAPGTFVGTATRTSTTPGGSSAAALDLTSSSSPDYVTGGDADKLDGLTQLTLTAWINLQGAPVNGNRIVAKQITTGNFDGFSFAFSTPTAGTISADNFQLNLALGGTGFVFNTSGTDMGANNRWAFVAVTYDGTQTADNLRFYNGSEAGSVSQFGLTRTANVGALIAHANEFRVGASSGATNSPPVLIDDVRVYNGVLGLTQLEAVRLANIPEPSTIAMVCTGFTGLALLSRRSHVGSARARPKHLQ